jgi:hypothetical protein
MNEHQKKTKTLTHKHTVTDVRETRLSESNYHNRIIEMNKTKELTVLCHVCKKYQCICHVQKN